MLLGKRCSAVPDRRPRRSGSSNMFGVRWQAPLRPHEKGRLRMLSVDELALLEAIRDSGSLSRAAARLGRAPSTVSHAARQLEGRFDALLFDRRRYRLQLTPAGHLLAQEASRLA